MRKPQMKGTRKGKVIQRRCRAKGRPADLPWCSDIGAGLTSAWDDACPSPDPRGRRVAITIQISDKVGESPKGKGSKTTAREGMQCNIITIVLLASLFAWERRALGMRAGEGRGSNAPTAGVCCPGRWTPSHIICTLAVFAWPMSPSWGCTRFPMSHLLSLSSNTLHVVRSMLVRSPSAS